MNNAAPKPIEPLSQQKHPFRRNSRSRRLPQRPPFRLMALFRRTVVLKKRPANRPMRMTRIRGLALAAVVDRLSGGGKGLELGDGLFPEDIFLKGYTPPGQFLPPLGVKGAFVKAGEFLQGGA